MAVREIMTPEQVADYLQLDPTTVYRYIRQGKLVAAKLGRNYRIPKANVDFFLLANSTSPQAREALFRRVTEIAERNQDIPLEEVQKDVAEGIAHVRAQEPND